MHYKLIQKYSTYGDREGFVVEVSYQDNFVPSEMNFSDLNDTISHSLQNMDCIREALLTNNFTTDSNYENLCRHFDQTRSQLNQVSKLLSEARKQYEIVQAFFKAQGIKDMSDFPNLNIPQLQGELLEKKNFQSEF